MLDDDKRAKVKKAVEEIRYQARLLELEGWKSTATDLERNCQAIEKVLQE